MSPKARTGKAAASADGGGRELQVSIKPFGPDPERLRAIGEGVVRDRSVARLLANTRHRLLRIDLVDPVEERKPARPTAPTQFRATLFDYTNNRSVIATGDVESGKVTEVAESALQPRPSAEEFAEAADVVRGNATQIGRAMADEELRPYRPMPPLVEQEMPDGRQRRVVSVGLMPRQGASGHEIVGVDLGERQVIRFEPSERGRAPVTSRAGAGTCGLPDANQDTLRGGSAGSAWVTVKQGSTTLWKFLVVRPAASSGTNGSGVELRYVDYRGKRLLYRAHVPILNVKYDGDACGPFRDWQDEEGMIQATGTDVTSWLRLCPTPATTILDTGSDVGNFLGVAIYVQGQEVVIVSEMEAGWYRYVSLWRLHANGTIKPRFGFAGVKDSCICNVHHHHAYWRLDFDLRTAGNNLVREFNDPPLFGSNWHDKSFEIRRPRDPGRKRKWRVLNKSTGEAYDIVPGATDGVATAQPDWPFPKGDVWILRYHGNEIDDGSVAVGPPYEAGLDAWVNGESIDGADVVVWYGAHFSHDVHHEEPGEFGHIVGPDLKRVKW